MIKKLFIAAFFIFQSIAGFTQNVAINNDNSLPDNSAILDLKSSSKGLLVPRMLASDIALISNPATGLIVFQKDGVAGFYYNKGTPGSPVWQLLGTTVTPAVISVSGYAGAVGTIAGSSTGFVFAGPSTTVTVAAGQKIISSASAGLGLTSGSLTIDVAICYQPIAGGTITPFVGVSNYISVYVTTTRGLFAADGTVSGLTAGQYRVGLGVRNQNVAALDNTDWINGWAMVTN